MLDDLIDQDVKQKDVSSFINFKVKKKGGRQSFLAHARLIYKTKEVSGPLSEIFILLKSQTMRKLF